MYIGESSFVFLAVTSLMALSELGDIIEFEVTPSRGTIADVIEIFKSRVDCVGDSLNKVIVYGLAIYPTEEVERVRYQITDVCLSSVFNSQGKIIKGRYLPDISSGFPFEKVTAILWIEMDA